MAEITASMVKALREETGQGMMECKKALTETSGDLEAAKDLLRKKGLATAEKKAERATSEGLVVVRKNDDSTSAAMAEIQCETDFCARNDVFRQMVDQVGDLVAAGPEGDVEANDEINAKVQDAFAKIGENMGYARGVKITAPKVGAYLHHNNKVGVIVGVDKADVDDDTLTDVCMHIAFSDPMGITADDIPADVVEKEKQFAIDQAVESGKPKDIAEKMVTGKMRKFMEQNALMEQAFVKDEKQQVKDVLGGATVTAFARYSVGGASA
jgi:elongation factor Ts